MIAPSTKEPGTFSWQRWLVATLLTALVACAPLYIAPTDRATEPTESARAEGLVYAFGDMGEPTRGFGDVTRSIAKELHTDRASGDVSMSPLLLALGDNLYPKGLPRPESGHTEPVTRLARLAELLATCQFGEHPAPLVLVPGNHDYANRALARDRDEGDITRWYYLDALEVAGVAHWTMLPGERPEDVPDAATLYTRLYETPEQLVEFMRPRRIPHTPASIAIVAIDSQLLIDLFDTGREDLADRYLDTLDAELARAASARWRVVAMHHPLESFGAHRVTIPGRFLLGPGWRQFGSPWDAVLAVPPLGIVATTARWAVASPQDLHASANRAYREAVLTRLARHDAPLVLSGHDHNSQLIELTPPGAKRPMLQLVTGEAAKTDPVTRGAGTLFYHSGHGYARLAVYGTHLEIAFRDRSGETLYRYRLEDGRMDASGANGR
ncbi:MAG: hypothetical protein GEU99_12275 [Luteitalea sp.]|nr:hypothetical protein [Luteitalea sp.]